jgi:hypothetical protein
LRVLPLRDGREKQRREGGGRGEGERERKRERIGFLMFPPSEMLDIFLRHFHPVVTLIHTLSSPDLMKLAS